MTDETSKNGDEVESADGGTQGPPAGQGVPTGSSAVHEPVKTARPWKKIALLVGGAVVLVGGTVVVTLAVTHNSAVRENLKAYLNGFGDAMDACAEGLLDCGDFYDEWN